MVDTPIGTNSPNYTLVPGDLGATIYCRVTATNASGSTNAISNVVGPITGAVLPANAGGANLPNIADTTPEVTVAVTCTQGIWTGDPTIIYAFQWKSGGTNVGTNSASYTPVVGDLGATLQCVVTATNGAGSASATSNTTGAVAAAPSSGFVYLADAKGQDNDSIVTSAIDTTGANLLIVAIADYSNTSTVSDNKGNTWTATPFSVVGIARVFYSYPTTVGTGHTITVTATSPPMYASACFMAFSGGAAGSFDDEVLNAGSGTTATGGSVTPSQNGSLIVSIVGIADAGGGSSSVGSGFTKICDEPHGAQLGLLAGYLIQSTASAVNPAWTVSGMDSWSALNVVFSPTVLAAARPM